MLIAAHSIGSRKVGRFCRVVPFLDLSDVVWSIQLISFLYFETPYMYSIDTVAKMSNKVLMKIGRNGGAYSTT